MSTSPRCLCVTGPECAGKTSLSEQLARSLAGVWLPEYSRTYLEAKGSAYGFDDLERIVAGQRTLENGALELAGGRYPVVLDTSFEVLYIWSLERFHEAVLPLEEVFWRPTDLYVLCSPDFPWQHDPLRENEHDRDRLFDRYHELLQSADVPYIIVKGTAEERLATVLQALSSNQP